MAREWVAANLIRTGSMTGKIEEKEEKGAFPRKAWPSGKRDPWVEEKKAEKPENKAAPRPENKRR